ncbi:MAG: rhomboid family intramembrane serine protease [Planctomycetaceae bacterium]
MGIHSRDYIRNVDGPSGYSGGSSEAWKKLLIATVVVFVLQLLTRASGIVETWLALDPDAVEHGQVWRLLTYAFCHETGGGLPLHILFNMLFLWWFGKTLESIYGSREFLIFYLVAALVAGLAFFGLALVLKDPSPAIGASGAVMAVVMVYAMHFPRQRIYIWGIIPIEIRWMVAAYVVFDLLPLLNAFSEGPHRDDGIAHSAHLGGLAFGFLYKKYNLRLSELFAGFKRPRFDRVVGRRNKIHIYKPSVPERDDNFDEQVDAILEKISKSGESSLNDREREILKAASQRYKDR